MRHHLLWLSLTFSCQQRSLLSTQSECAPTSWKPRQCPCLELVDWSTHCDASTRRDMTHTFGEVSSAWLVNYISMILTLPCHTPFCVESRGRSKITHEVNEVKYKVDLGLLHQCRKGKLDCTYKLLTDSFALRHTFGLNLPTVSKLEHLKYDTTNLVCVHILYLLHTCLRELNPHMLLWAWQVLTEGEGG